MNVRFYRNLSYILAVLAGTAPIRLAAADEFTVDPSHTSVIFGISHLGLSYTYGRFNKVGGTYALDRQNPANSVFNFAVAADSVDTNDEQRDAHLKGADFFNVRQFPQITFDSKSVVYQDGDRIFKVTGILSLHGVKKEETLDFKLLGEGDGPFGNYRSGFLCEARILRSKYGMTNMLDNIGDEVALTISFEGIRKAAPAQ